MSKRKKFVLTSVLLSLGFVAVQFIDNTNRFWSIVLLSISTLILFWWSLKDTLGKDMTILTLVLPFIFTIGVGLFWFLLPINIYARIPIIIVYAIGIYVLCLTMNIFTISVNKTIALLRAARGVGFVVSLVTLFLVVDAILSLKAELFITTPLIFVVSFFLFAQSYWSVVPEREYQSQIVKLAIIAALILSELNVMIFFWPSTVAVSSLFFTMIYYVLTGLGQAYLEGRLFSNVIKDYLVVGFLVFVAIFFTTHWG